MYHIKINSIIISILCCLAFAGCRINAANNSSSGLVSQEISSPMSAELEAVSLLDGQLDKEGGISPEKTPLEQAVISAVLEQNRGKYLPGEYQGAGCKIFETFEDGDKLAVYALIEYIEYGFMDGCFVNVSGTRSRVLLDFQTEQESHTLTGYTVLDSSSGLSDMDLEALMAPLKETGKDYFYTDDDFHKLREQVNADAKEYLKSIGREAEVIDRASRENGFLSLLNGDAYHMLVKDSEISCYPDWEGTLERLEDGVRYIYQAHFDDASNKIEYTKKNYDTGETVKEITVDAATGKRIL
jgi:hypothetical protein